MWSKLIGPWEKESPDYYVWRRTCQFLTAYLEETEQGVFLLSIESVDGHSCLYEQLLIDINNSFDAMNIGSQILYDFVVVGVEVLGEYLSRKEAKHFVA